MFACVQDHDSALYNRTVIAIDLYSLNNLTVSHYFCIIIRSNAPQQIENALLAE